MTFNDLRPHDNLYTDLPEYRRVLWSSCTVIQNNRQRAAGYNGEKWSLRRPDEAPAHYKRRKLSSMLVGLDDAENVTWIELHYGGPMADGYAVRMNPDTGSLDDVTSFYRRSRLQ